MARKPLLSPELATYVAERFVSGDVPARELVIELKSKFGADVKPEALRQFISRRGLARRKREVDKKVCTLVSAATGTAIAKAKAAGPAQHLERWATKTVTLSDK